MLLLLLLCAGMVSGFRPNHESGGISPSDYTNADITERGALKAVAWYMERNPLPGRAPMAPGKLENMIPLNLTWLFKVHYQADVTPIRCEQAVQDVIIGNNIARNNHREDSSFFFHCEQFGKSINRIRNLYDSMLASLSGEVNSTGLEAARSIAGQILLILQEFYSNSNWVELGKRNPYEYLLNAQSPAFPVAPLSKKTCRDCERQPSGQFLCSGNILVQDMLTSSYKVSNSCRMKARGKCGHGGKNDVSQSFPVTGGINKETSNPDLSPHYLLHEDAANLAIEATKSFFVGPDYGLLSQVGDDTFKKFFNLDGYSLVFVIDTTGSMSDDIRHVKTSSIKLLRNYSGSADAPFNYILVPFNDPDVGPIVKTHSVDELESAISRLTATGGGDCPEMSMTGLKLALQESLPRSKIFVFTDAGAKDEYLRDKVQILIDSSRSVVNFLLTGECRRRKRRSSAEEGSRTPSNIYEETARYSNGYYVFTTKSQLPQVLGIMEMSLNSAPVRVANSRVYVSQFSFPVDETLKDMTISVKASSSFSINVLQPSGSPLGSLNKLVNTANHKVVKISSISEQGSWTVTLSPINTYEIQVEGKSLLDFSYQIMEEQNGYVLPIQGRPVKGSDYVVSIKLMGDTAGMQLQHLVLISELGTPLELIALNQSFDAFGNIWAVAPVSFRAQRTLLKVEGLSPGNFSFSRISSDPITTESVQILSLPDQNNTMVPGGTLELSVLVVNHGTATAFTFKVWDDLDFTSYYTPTSSFLNAGENVTLTATFVIPVGNNTFASSVVTFTAKSTSAQNYLKIPIMVIPEAALETDEIPPVHKLRQFFMPCKRIIQQKLNCSEHLWRMEFSAMDAESAVTVRINTNPSGLSCTPKEDDNKNVLCSFSSTCCTPSAEVLISDESGNTDTFTMDPNLLS